MNKVLYALRWFEWQVLRCVAIDPSQVEDFRPAVSEERRGLLSSPAARYAMSGKHSVRPHSPGLALGVVTALLVLGGALSGGGSEVRTTRVSSGASSEGSDITNKGSLPGQCP